MAWTAPRTWVHAEIVSAAIMNTHVRDNLLETAPGKATAQRLQLFSTGANAIAMIPGSRFKAADEIVISSTTLQDDNDLAFPLAASEVWEFSMLLYWTIASGDPGFKLNFTVPAGASGFYQVVAGFENLGLGTNNVNAYSQVLGTPIGMVITGKTSIVATVRGVVVNAATAGFFWLQWAQNALVASNLTLKAGSYLDLKRMA